MAFVQDFLDVAVDFDAACETLVDAGRSWLAPPNKLVRVEAEQPYQRGDTWVVPFHWVATAVPALFPTMEAELSVAPLGPAEVRLTVRGHYRPPFGGVGQVADTMVLHRVVEGTIRTFLGGLGEGLLRRGSSTRPEPRRRRRSARCGGEIAAGTPR